MKLYRFVAPSNQKAIMKVNEVLGLDALLFETRTTEEGVEMLAGLPGDNQATNGYELPSSSVSSNSTIMESTLANSLLIEQLQSQIRVMDDNIQTLIAHIQQMQTVSTKSKFKIALRWNPIKTWTRSRKSNNKEVYDEQPAH